MVQHSFEMETPEGFPPLDQSVVHTVPSEFELFFGHTDCGLTGQTDVEVEIMFQTCIIMFYFMLAFLKRGFEGYKTFLNF